MGNGIAFKLSEIKKIEGDASVTIRKKKQLFLFNFEIEVGFSAVAMHDKSVCCEGTIKILEFN